MKKIKVFTWHIHGSYLYYLSQANCEFYLPVGKEGDGYGGRVGDFLWGDNVHEVPINQIPNIDFDILLFQSKEAYLYDQYKIFSDKQRALPKIYIEHDPPREHPTDTTHIVNDSEVTLVHVTHFNDLMWDCGLTPTTVIDHGVMIEPNISYTGKTARGVVVINNLKSRGRRLGLDIFEKIRKEIPLDLIGMGSKELGGLGEIPHSQIPQFVRDYRFFFSPIRYTSLGLSICEAMMIGMPVVGLATTELPLVIEPGISGFIDTDISKLIKHMRYLIDEPKLAKEIGKQVKKVAKQKFSIERFKQNWETLFNRVVSRNTSSQPVTYSFQLTNL